MNTGNLTHAREGVKPGERFKSRRTTRRLTVVERRGKAFRSRIDSSVNEARARLEGRVGPGTLMRDSPAGLAKINAAVRRYAAWCAERGLPGPRECR